MRLSRWYDHPESVRLALVELDARTLAVAEALAALGELAHRDELADLLGEPAQISTSEVDRILADLQGLALAWQVDPGLWHVTAGLLGCFPRPFGLGPPLHRLLPQQSPYVLHRLRETLGIGASGPPTALFTSIEGRLADPQVVAAIAVGAPAEVADTLRSLVERGDVSGLAVTFPGWPSDLEGDDDAEHPGLHPHHVLQWLADVGFLLTDARGSAMPREIARLLRGRSWRPTLPVRPSVVHVPVHAESVERESASSATSLLLTVASLLDALTERPLRMLKDGGVGIRETRRVAGQVRRDVAEVELGPLSELLTGCADPEIRGVASVWRFSAGSVRRAFDAGADADGLVDRLQSVAGGPLPQPLVYLVHDVGRRHGQVRVATLASVLLVDDPALAAEVLSDATVSALGLRLLAPGVVASRLDATTTVRLLRDAGHLPVTLDEHGAVRLEAVAREPVPSSVLGPGLERFGRHIVESRDRDQQVAELVERVLGQTRRR